MYTDLFAQDVKRVLKKRQEFISIDKEEYYCHPTVYVHSVSEFINIVEAISPLVNRAVNYNTILYRGIPDKSYSCLPGLARLSCFEEFTEVQLVNDFRARRPDAFANLTDFDVLAKMQHYGLPTRLLDYTLNPLVALYFACETKPKVDGRVLCHGSFLLNDSDVFVKSLCETIINKHMDENYSVDEYFCNERFSARSYLSAIYLHAETKVVRPKYWNQRIANQSGVFMIFPNNHYDKYMRILIMASRVGLDKAIKEYGHCIVDKNEIERVLEYEPLQFYSKKYDGSISDEIFRKMVEAYKDKDIEEEFWNSIGKRLCVLNEIKPLDRDKIKNQFFSIIIDKNDKKRIIESLSRIGIREDYIYPELEYTAKEVKKQYELTMKNWR